MTEAVSRVSTRYQTVIPGIVRRRLGLAVGDSVRFRLDEAGNITVEKVQGSEDDPFATFAEWNSDEDEELYRHL